MGTALKRVEREASSKISTNTIEAQLISDPGTVSDQNKKEEEPVKEDLSTESETSNEEEEA